jgi:hypothetical protein
LKYNLLPASIRSQMQMCGRETLEQLDRHCQMLLQEWGKRESLASNMNVSVSFFWLVSLLVVSAIEFLFISTTTAN